MADAQTTINNSLARLKDPDKTTWTDADLLKLLNHGIAYIQQKLILWRSPLAVTTSHVEAEDGEETYTLASYTITDFYAVYEDKIKGDTGVWYTDTSSYTFLTPTDQQESIEYTNAAEGPPEKYYLNDTQIGFLPVPDTDYTIYIRYYRAHTDLAVGGTMPYNGIFNEALSVFMSSMAFTLAEFAVGDMVALYNDLEATAMSIVALRSAKRPKFVLKGA